MPPLGEAGSGGRQRAELVGAKMCGAAPVVPPICAFKNAIAGIRCGLSNTMGAASGRGGQLNALPAGAAAILREVRASVWR